MITIQSSRTARLLPVAGLLLAAAAVPLVTVAAEQDAAHPVRTWSDDTGRFQIKASLTACEGRFVRLRKLDGTEIQVPLDRLSSRDRQYVRRERASAAASSKLAWVGSQRRHPSSGGEPQRQPTENRFGINWHLSPAAALAAADDELPVMWFRVLGDLDGFM